MLVIGADGEAERAGICGGRGEVITCLVTLGAGELSGESGSSSKRLDLGIFLNLLGFNRFGGLELALQFKKTWLKIVCVSDILVVIK